MIPARYVIVAILLFFSWRGVGVDIQWPPNILPPATGGTKPDAESVSMASPLVPILPKMLVSDRQYLADFYDALGWIIERDGQREKPIVVDTEAFAAFHAGSLKLAIDRANVGKYTGLDTAIDQVFFSALGAEVKSLDRVKAVKACRALSWAFRVNGDG